MVNVKGSDIGHRVWIKDFWQDGVYMYLNLVIPWSMVGPQYDLSVSGKVDQVNFRLLVCVMER